MHPVQAIYFDAVGTLIHPEPSAAVVYAAAARRFGSNHNVEEIARRFSRAFANEERADEAAGWVTSEERELARWRNIVASVLDDTADPDACFDHLYRHFALPSAWRCEADAEDLLDRLHELGYTLGIASNYDARLHPLVQGFNPLRWLRQNIVVSSEVGYRKPAGGFFQAMCRQAGLEPARILYVGDDPNNDCVGAQSSGMRAVLFDPRGRRRGWPDIRIEAIAELQDVLAVF
jgi:putative hydrolase of the HAD superfamily